MIGIGKRIGNNKLQFTEGDAYAASQGATLVNPVCEQVQRNKLRGIALNAAIGFVNAAIASALEDGATVLLTVDEIVDQLPSNYAEASFLYIPFARKAGVSYALKGPNLVIDRNSNATEVARNLLLAQAGLNVPRIEFFKDENLEPWSNTFTEWSLGAGTNSSLPVIAGVLEFTFGVNLLASGQSGNAYATSDFTPSASQVYTYTAFVKAFSGAALNLGKASITSGGVVNYTAFKALGDGVYFMVVVETAAASPSALQVGQTLSGYNDLGEAVYFAGIQVRKGDHRGVLPEYYMATNGAAVYQSRPLAHRLEAQGINLFFYPNQADQWSSFTNATATANAAIGPSGNQDADEINGVGGWVAGDVTSGLVIGQVYTIQAKIKAKTPGSKNTFRFFWATGGSVNFTATGEWQTFSAQFTAGVTSGILGLFRDSSSNDSDLYVADVDVKRGGLSSYVAGSGSASTRLVENATATLASALQSYMIVIRFRLVSAPVADSALIDKTTSGQDAAGRIRIDTQGRLYYTSTATGSLSLMSALSSAENVYVLRVNAGLVDQFINGAKGATSGTNASDVASALKIVGGANIQVLQCSVIGVENDAWCLENSQP